MIRALSRRLMWRLAGRAFGHRAARNARAAGRALAMARRLR
ncbi:hypothetical protein [Jannaschia sp. W003]|nr:hypothetical protein [Jannaschia sp. W003]